MDRIGQALMRKKILDPEAIAETELARVLNYFDLTALGIGSTLGVGVYVLAGHVAKDIAGPAVILSFLIAAIASVFAGLCYAEFGSRVPRAGSAYIYSYVCIGEFVAFIIGWNLILEYVIGSASVAKGLSLYLDTLINSTLENTFKEIAPINVSFLATYFDFFSFVISVVLAAALAFGMKGSASVNNIFTIVNLAVVLFVVIAGSFKADFNNWKLPPPSNSNGTFGTGGFFPYGATGVIQGAATCFYGFVGFDCIATTGEEVKNPQRVIPLAIISSLAVIFLAYFGTATVITLMIPYFLQDINAPLPFAFEEVGWSVAKWIVSIGGIFGLCASLFGAMFPLPRILYAMASDGVIFKFLGKVDERFQTPLIGTLLAGVLTGLMAGLFDLKQLVNMMSIGTLLAYSIVAACVILLRYTGNDNLIRTTSTGILSAEEKVTFRNVLRQMFNLRFLNRPTKTSKAVVVLQIFIFILLTLVLWLCVILLQKEIKHAQVWIITLLSIIGLLLILSAMSIAMQPNSQTELKFKVPLVPLIPLLSILANVYLMLMLDIHTWIRFGCWMLVGLPMYFISIRCGDSLSNNKINAKNLSKFIDNKVVTNGHANISFVVDEKTVLEKTSKEDLGLAVALNFIPKSNKLKPKAPLPSMVASTTNSLDVLSVSGALAALDEALTKEESMAVPNFMYDNPFGRKVSIDTVSNASNVFHEESVVALIHREDINDFDHPPPIIEEQTDVESESSVSEKMDEDEVPKKRSLTVDVQENIPLPPPLPSMAYFTTPLPRKISKIEKRSRSIHDISDNFLKNSIKTGKAPLSPFENRTLKHENLNLNNESTLSLSRSKSEPDFLHNTESPTYTEDNVTFGSKLHTQIAGKLNILFKKRSMGLPIASKLTRPEAQQESTGDMQKLATLSGLKNIFAQLPKNMKNDKDNDINETQGVVVEETLKPADIKKKLNEILRSDPRMTKALSKSNIAVNQYKEELNIDEDGDKCNEETNDEELKAKLLHKNLMGNTLMTIKLRKVNNSSDTSSDT
ncbi:hypothetical protein FQA39_LY01063 [Lamprigera yunnana]|nr:hypothetical protein FQA39_LY01063 [Lamprigera yunnana]